MSNIRSKQMFLYKMNVSKDHAWQATTTLGESDAAHIINMNPDAPPF